jgi:putative transposase
LTLLTQCELVGVSRSSLYYRARPESSENIELMRLLDEQYTATPFYGVRKMTEVLRQSGFLVGPKRVRRLLRTMGLQAIYQRPNLSRPAPGHRIYPYLLRDVVVNRPDQVWSSDITYIRLHGGFVYLVAVIDWFTRYVLAWQVSTSMESDFCVAALMWALSRGKPEIFNTDQGSQFTSDDFTRPLLNAGIAISMDGRGRALDNVFVERLWRSVKYEDIFLKDYASPAHATAGLGQYLTFYNNQRIHQALDYRTPASMYLRT